MHCVFYGHPSLEAVIRSIPATAQIEAGIVEIDEERNNTTPTNPTSARKDTEMKAYLLWLQLFQRWLTRAARPRLSSFKIQVQ